MHIETDARGNQAQSLLDGYLLIAAASKAGAEIAGSLPKHNNQAQFWVQYVVSIPANYNVEISTVPAIFKPPISVVMSCCRPKVETSLRDV